MQQYQSTPDYYRDYIEHGYLKDAAAKVHKYIERWKGKNGKWYYRYKSKAQEAITKFNRNEDNIKRDPETITTNYGKKELISFGRRNWSGRPNSILDGSAGSKSIKTTKVTPKKKGNLSSRGYSSSQGSGESKRQRNLGTRKVAGSNRIGTTITIKDPNRKPKFESLSGSGKDGYGYNEPGWYWRAKSLESLSKRQDRNGYKVETYTVSNGKKKKKK